MIVTQRKRTHSLSCHASNAGDMDMIPGQGTKMSHAAWCSQEKKNVKKKKKNKNSEHLL